MSAEIEAVAVELDSLGQAADEPVRLEDARTQAAAGQDVRRSQAGRARTENRNLPAAAALFPCSSDQGSESRAVLAR